MSEPINQSELLTSGADAEASAYTSLPGDVLDGNATPSSQAEPDLRTCALSDSRDWTITPKRRNPRLLKKKWQEVSRSIQELCAYVRHIELCGEKLSSEAEELMNNSRLLKTVIEDIRAALKGAARLPEIETHRGEAAKRAQVAAAAYLSATHHTFEENSFLIYFSSVEQSHPLEISEVWALKAMMQFVQLGEIAAIAQRLVGRDPEHHAKNAKLRNDELPLRLSLLIKSLHDMSDLDWRETVDKVSVVERILREDPLGTYPTMDRESRDLYHAAIQELATHSEACEADIAKKAISLARTARSEWNSDLRVKERREHVGYYLVGRGRNLLEQQISFHPPLSKQIERAVLAWPEVFYLVGIEILAFAAMAFVLGGVFPRIPLIIGLFLLLLPAIEAAVGVMNQLVSFTLPPRVLPKVDFSEGIPSECTTLVVVPTQLLDKKYVARMAEELEVRFLANRDPNLHFALLTDLPDSRRPIDDDEEIVELCAGRIQELNSRYMKDGKGTFFLFHRRHVFNPSEDSWMGWERKRGKLLDLNNLLRGNSGSFSRMIGDRSVLPRVRYVITLDADTQLPRGVAHKLVGTLAHPLNRAVINPFTNVVVEGYGIIQPKVGISVHAAGRSVLASIYSGQTGFDPYTRATSDVYQDLFGEGIFTGKGIYEVDVFQRVLAERFPCNAILSHDLIEGTHARAGLASDVEVIDDYPSHFSAYSRRKHRWVRGDWQLIQWLLPRVPDLHGNLVPNPLSLISRWKILDNLRRSIIEIATLALLIGAWGFQPGSPLRWTLATLVLMLIPAYAQLLLSILRAGRAQNVPGYIGETADNFISGQVNVFLLLAFLPYQTLVLLDAILRTIVRLTITKKKLLEWETAAEAERRTHRTRVDIYLVWIPWFSLAVAIGLALSRPEGLLVAAPFLVLWAFSARLAHWLDRPMRPIKATLSRKDQEFLRIAGLRTWRFFRQFTKQSPYGLVPDNIQEAPPHVAQRISPTNLGLLLNSQLAAYELGYLTLLELVSELEKTLSTAKHFPRYKGHFFNWYDTQTLEPLGPKFISTVDSGNLACSLWTLKQACLKCVQEAPWGVTLWRGLSDHFRLVVEVAGTARIPRQVAHRIGQLSAWIDLLGENSSGWIQSLPALEEWVREIEQSVQCALDANDEFSWWISETLERIRSTRTAIGRLTPWLAPEYSAMFSMTRFRPQETRASLPLNSFADTLADILVGFREQERKGGAASGHPTFEQATTMDRVLLTCLAELESLTRKLRQLAADADALVQDMDFRFLFDHRRKLLSIGYDVTAGRLDASCYDLLASEARAAAFVAIAKGDIPQESWFRMGRTHVAWAGERVLVSWAGTMFEYLMPTLWMKNYAHTILDESARSAVGCQQKWAAAHEVPWGISEAACGNSSPEGHYRYQSFGVPPLALRRTQLDDLVVSPYSTFLALDVDPNAAVQNLLRMKRLNWLGTYGFYEAADFSPSRLKPLEGYKLVRSWMTHHQGMSLAAIANLLGDGAFRDLFHAEPAVAATEHLLHEKLSRSIRVEPAEQVSPSRSAKRSQIAGVPAMPGWVDNERMEARSQAWVVEWEQQLGGNDGAN